MRKQADQPRISQAHVVGNPLPERIRSLSGLRGFAALWVWLYHAWLVAGNRPVAILGFDFTPLVSGGWVGVDLFFVLSGFVLAWPYALEKRKKFSWAEFMRRRALRVIPAYYSQFLILILIGVFFGVVDIPSLSNALAHLLFVHNFSYEWSSSVNDAWWTLPIEWQFYLSFPLLLFLLLKRSGAFSLLFISIIVALAWRIGAMHWIESTYQSAKIGEKVWLIEQIPGRIDQFCIGMCAALFTAKIRRSEIPSQKLQIYSSGLIISGFFSVFALLYVIANHAEEYWSGHYLLYTWHIFCGFCLAAFITGAALGGRLGEMLFSNRPLRAVGEISYSIYLWHFPVFVLLVDAGYFMGIGSEYYFIKIAMSSIPPIFFAATVSWLLTERPFLYSKTTSDRASIFLPAVTKKPLSFIFVLFAIILLAVILGDRYTNYKTRNMPPECHERGSVDSPISINHTSSAVEVVGWAHDSRPGDPIVRVIAVSQEKILGSGSADLARPDVRKALPTCRVKKPGYSINLDTSKIAGNVVEILIQAELKSGHRYKLGKLDVFNLEGTH